MNLRYAAIFLLPFPLLAQLEIPEYLFPETVPEERVNRNPQGHESAEKKEAPAKEPAISKEEAQQREQMMHMMNNAGPMAFQGRMNPQQRPANLPDDSRQVKRLTGGPNELLAQVALSNGKPFQGKLLNQVVLVEASFGKLPLRLGEVQRLLLQDEGLFLFEIRGGDVLQGKLLHQKLTFHLPDGGKRVVSLLELQSVELTPVDPEPASP